MDEMRAFQFALAGTRSELGRLRHQVALAKLRLLHRRYLRKYNPDQPRVPAGSSEGGQWTNGDGGSDLNAAQSTGESFSAARRRGRSEAYCWAQLTIDNLLCNSVTPASRRAICRGQAMERYAACLRGRPLPPLNY